MKVTELKAGRELDQLVDEKVMGRHAFPKQVISLLGQHVKDPCLVCGRIGHNYIGECLPHYSTSIAAAWEVMEKMKSLVVFYTKQGNWFVAEGELDENYGDEWWFGSSKKQTEEYGTIAETAPIAICLEALKAVGYKDAD